ncbi:MAG: hypothetical protein K2X03_16350 [Bryobacteraceae bacterium]|nr:hypothetical protein [Bryobacteraceae bacterium]
MLRSLRLSILCAVMANFAFATTLEQLTMDDLLAKSTRVVRGRVNDCSGSFRGAMIYTSCSVTVIETLKGTPGSQARFAVPGGRAGTIRQSISGAPQFETGVEYVLFLWTSPSGFTQILGLSQGKFEVRAGSTGAVATRDAISDVTMLDGMGQEVRDQGVRMTLTVLRERLAALGSAKQ